MWCDATLDLSDEIRISLMIRKMIFKWNQILSFDYEKYYNSNLKAVINIWHQWKDTIRQWLKWNFSLTYPEKFLFIIPPAQRSCWGVYWFHSVCPSIRPASCVRSVAPTVLVGSISYLYILSSNFRRCVACKVCCKIWKNLNFGNFFKFVTFTLSCFDLGSDVNH